MVNRKLTKKYYFSVEGETEQWYLKWLQDRSMPRKNQSTKFPSTVAYRRIR